MKSDREKQVNWEIHGVCQICGWHQYAPFGDLFHLHVNCCPKCGNPRNGFNIDYNKWTTDTMAWVSSAVWWKPSTWLNGKWITNEKENKK